LKSDIARDLGKRVCYLRRCRHLTQEAFAKSAALPVAFIRRIERGELKNPSLERLEALAIGLDVPVSVLFEVYENFDETSYDKDMLIRHLARMLNRHGLTEIRAVQVILREVFAIQRLGRK